MNHLIKLTPKCLKANYMKITYISTRQKDNLYQFENLTM